MITNNNNFNCSCCGNLYTNIAQNTSPMTSICGHDICSFCVNTLKSTVSTQKPLVPLRCLKCNIPITEAYYPALASTQQIGNRSLSSSFIQPHMPANPSTPSTSPQELLSIWTATLSLGYDSIENNCDMALLHFEHALRLLNNLPPESNRFSPNILQAIGACYQKKNNPTEALKYYTRALEIQESYLGEDNLHLFPILMGIGWCHFEGKKAYSTAFKFYYRALKIQETCGSERQPSQLPLLNMMAICRLQLRDSLNENSSYRAKQDKQFYLLSAFEYLQRARRCFKHSSLKGNLNQIFTLQQLINCTKLLNDEKRERKYTNELKAISVTPT